MSRNIKIELIETDPNQPRKTFNQANIDELAESMKENGLIIPIMVRPDLDRYIIVHGERRYRAAMSLGWTHIAAEVKQVDQDDASWLALIENIQRQDLSPIEEALAYKERLAMGITQIELGKRIGKSQSYIAQKLRLLKLPEEIQLPLMFGHITEGHARQVLRLEKVKYVRLHPLFPDVNLMLKAGRYSLFFPVSELKRLIDLLITSNPKQLPMTLEALEAGIEINLIDETIQLIIDLCEKSNISITREHFKNFRCLTMDKSLELKGFSSIDELIDYTKECERVGEVIPVNTYVNTYL